MAMDKEKLLAHFQTHYLSRQEVLFKLPLNYSIDQFWPELLNRRKAKAVILPLYNAAGMPYWYVLTQKMVTASERLCEEAIAQDGSFDPYRAEMTSAMTEEMFFTSFVEGAQIPLQEAMDFLARGTEPESIQEQMIWNNRHAWSEMVSGIYRPLDETFVKGLAWMLTEEMDGCAEDYRQVDNHPIAAMNSEPYDLPPAYSLPERMEQYYAFLRAPDTHPLIKATVAQAYPLAIRPFPEGNERLSRMMSSAVLLRCGYDFFRDISISSVIARENYRYYKAMCDILRPENGGDMTYFMEYYLDLLARAVDLQKERLRRKEEDALTRERALAREPLKATAVSPPAPQGEPSAAAPEEAIAESDAPSDERSAIDSFLATVDKLKHSQNPKTRRLPALVRDFLDGGGLSFTAQQWAEHSGQKQEDTDFQCSQLLQKGLIDRDIRGEVITYTFRVTQTASSDQEPEDEDADGSSHSEEASESPPISEKLMSWIENSEVSDYGYRKKVAAYFRELIAAGSLTFTSKDLIEQTGLSKAQAKSVCNYLVRRQAIINPNPDIRPATFRLATEEQVPENIISDRQADNSVPMDADDSLKAQKAFGAMLISSSDTLRQAAETILHLAEQGYQTFLRSDWPGLTGIPKDRANDTCDIMLKRGIIINENPRRHLAEYRINVVPPSQDTPDPPPAEHAPVHEEGAEAPQTPGTLTAQEQRIAAFLEQKKQNGQTQFTSDEWMRQFHMTQSGYNNDLRKAAAMGLITKVGTSKNRFAVYEINSSLLRGIREEGLTRLQKEMLEQIHAIFGTERFTVSECAARLQQETSALKYYLDLFVDRSILSVRRQGSRPSIYELRVSPQTHPNCFICQPIPSSTTGWTNPVPMVAAPHAPAGY